MNNSTPVAIVPTSDLEETIARKLIGSLPAVKLVDLSTTLESFGSFGEPARLKEIIDAELTKRGV